MNHVQLLVVEECFQWSDAELAVAPELSVPQGPWRGLTVAPDFPFPEGGLKVRVSRVIVVRPDGTQFETDAQFHISHFNLSDPLDRRVIVSLPMARKEQVPVGSRLLVTEEVRNAVLRADA